MGEDWEVGKIDVKERFNKTRLLLLLNKMNKIDKPWYKKWWAITGFIFVILLIVGFFLPNKEDSNNSNLPNQNSIIELRDISVTSQIVKKVDGKCRYFFDIRNNDNADFEGSVKVILINSQGNSVWNDIFTTNQAIKPTLGTSVYTEAYTCPVSIHGSNGIATYEYEVKINNQLVKTGTGVISNNFEDLS
ncbi:MAG: hypothetical protein AABX99_04000 [Nanoarchaeota archaeon]